MLKCNRSNEPRRKWRIEEFAESLFHFCSASVFRCLPNTACILQFRSFVPISPAAYDEFAFVIWSQSHISPFLLFYSFGRKMSSICGAVRLPLWAFTASSASHWYCIRHGTNIQQRSIAQTVRRETEGGREKSRLTSCELLIMKFCYSLRKFHGENVDGVNEIIILCWNGKCIWI